MCRSWRSWRAVSGWCRSIRDRRAAASFILWVKEMNRYMQIPETIKEIRREDIPALSKHAAAEGNPLYPVPVLMDAKELAGMYEKIMEKGAR